MSPVPTKTRRMPLVVASPTAALTALVVAAAAHASDLHVPRSFPTIQAAIDASVDGDHIVIAPGTYAGVGNVNLSFGGRLITVRSADPTDPAVVASTVLDGEGVARGFEFTGGEGPDASIRGLTIRNMSGGASGSFGSAIKTRLGSAPTVADCVIVQCTNTALLATQVSGMFVERCTIANNSRLPVAFGAGGITSSYASDVVVTDCTIVDNEGDAASCTGGATLTLVGCNLSDNDGRGVTFAGGGSLVVRRCTLSSNSSQGYGGGIFFQHLGPTESAISDCLIVGNSAAGWGGGVYVAGSLDSTFLMTGCTIAGNVSGGSGGGVSCSAESGVIRHCILWGNEAVAGDNLHMDIVTNGLISFPANLELSYSLLSMDPKSVALAPSAVLLLGEGMLDGDPMFTNARAGDYHLTGGSPCVDAGDPGFVPAPAQLDIDGDARVLGPRVDIGADERHVAADLNDDGAVDGADLSILLALWGRCGGCPADLDGNGEVDAADLATLLGSWGA